ncbi:uracil-DNA glycosylase [Pollutimonas bauzanensis]|uniref:uracil-DNA glycosylase n=1 Tax=Pollutimonas bauzanensis TaxID=658167 RepID=UPI003340DC12
MRNGKKAGFDMTETLLPKAPELTALQITWLQEIGIDKRMLARYATGSGPFPKPQVAALQGQAESAPEPRPEAPAAAADAAQGLTHVAAVLAQRQPGAGAGRLAAGAKGKSTVVDTPVRAEAMPDDWDALADYVAACQACDLHAGRSQTVFGTGAVQAPEWMVIGEAPGELDDKVGLPLQGRPGVLLQAMLASIGVLPDSAVFLTNLIKCRPLGNRTPKPAEIAACLPYLQRQIAILKPRRILALGNLAAQALLGVETELDQLRGQVHHLQTEAGQDIPLVATYHPASLLLRPQHKADAWQDLNLARTMLQD